MQNALNATALQKIFKVLDTEMTTPTTFGWYHILWLVVLVGLCVVIAVYGKKLSDKRYDQILLITSVVLIALEIYKQLNFSYDWETNEWDYQWYAFPYQFCSTPMYVMPLALLFRKQTKIRDALRAYLATFSLFAGLAVTIYPSSVFIGTIGINIQTMVHHGSMLVIGVLTWVSGKAKTEFKTILQALPVFITLLSVAFGVNLFWLAVGNEETFNMFYISPYYECEIPILNSLQKILPYPVFLLAYILGFSLAAYLMLLSATGIRAIYLKYKKSPSNNPPTIPDATTTNDTETNE